MYTFHHDKGDLAICDNMEWTLILLY